MKPEKYQRGTAAPKSSARKKVKKDLTNGGKPPPGYPALVAPSGIRGLVVKFSSRRFTFPIFLHNTALYFELSKKY